MTQITELRQLTEAVSALDPDLYDDLGGLTKAESIAPCADHLFKKNAGYFWAALGLLNAKMTEKLLAVTSGSLTANVAATFLSQLSANDQAVFLRACGEMLVPYILPHLYQNTLEKQVQQDRRRLHCIIAKMWLLAFGEGNPSLTARKNIRRDKPHECSCKHKLMLSLLERCRDKLKIKEEEVVVVAKISEDLVVEMSRNHGSSCPLNSHKSTFYWRMPHTVMQMVQDLSLTLTEIQKQTSDLLKWLPEVLVNIINQYLLKKRVTRTIKQSKSNKVYRLSEDPWFQSLMIPTYWVKTFQ